MADENFERRMEDLAEEQARFAAKMAEVEDIIVAFRNASGVRSKATYIRPDNLGEKTAALFASVGRVAPDAKSTEETIKNTDEALRSLIAEMERCFSKGRNRDF
jgi:hypothetical protein